MTPAFQWATRRRGPSGKASNGADPDPASPSEERLPGHGLPRTGHFSLVAWFLLLSLITVSAVSVTAAILLTRFVSDRMLALDLKQTTEFVNHMFAVDYADRSFGDARDHLESAELVRFFTHVGRLPDVLRANIYQLDGTVIWSTDKSIIGLHFDRNDELAEAAEGKPQYSTEIAGEETSPKPEHINLPETKLEFVESYIPLFRDGQVGGEVLGVAEIYRTPQQLMDTVRDGKRNILYGAAAGTLLIVACLCWLVSHADRVIRRQKEAMVESERLATAGEMASAVAHGLRNPLAAIRSSAELAIRLRSPERVFPLLDDIVSQSDRLEHWVRQYLRAVEPESGDNSSELAPTLATVRAALASEFDRCGITWLEKVSADLPPVRIGQAMLEQLVNGIVANAVQAMPDGGTITVSATQEDGGMMALQISDTGCGMTAEQLKRAFQPFVTSKQSGLGLGLALARRILARHQGRIFLASSSGQGTVATLHLPVSK